MDSCTSRVNFCLLLSSLGIHFFRDCHFLLNLTSTVFTIHKVCCVSLFQFLPWQVPCLQIMPSPFYPSEAMWCYRFIHTDYIDDRCKCTGTLTSPHPPHPQPWRDVASTSWCKCTGTLTSPHPPHPQPWRDVASTSWCKCTWTLTSPHPPQTQPWRDVAST